MSPFPIFFLIHSKMNQLSLVIVALVAFTYFGGSYAPSVLKSNKQMLLGVVGGLVLCSFFGMRLEGWDEEGCLDVLWMEWC